MLQPTGSHARFIHSIIRGSAREEGARPPEHVRRSWLRCVNEYGLDPQSHAEPVVLSREEFLLCKDRNAELVPFAETEMAHLYQQLSGSGHSIILTDREGVLVSYYGDPGFKRAASRTGLVLGALWSERHGGTNGMGTCLFERAPLIIHRDQHFLTRNTGLTCCAAPIFDHRGQLLAVLDASGESDRAQQHTLVLVSMSAQMIENRLFLHRFRDAFVVRFHSRPELVGTWSEGIIALGLDGAIAAVDRNALFQLGCKTSAELTGAPLERLFNISLPALVARSHRKSFHPLPIYEARHGGRFFAVAQEPESRQAGSSAARTGIRSGGSPDADRSALDELNLGDPVMARNIQAAKRVASRDVPILLIGETGTGKELFARALHAVGDRAGAPFVAINCAALPEAHVAHELFGYPASASAAAPREGLRGKIAQANGGTLFLDEIGAMPLPVQAQLLHLLEEGEIIDLDTEAPIKVNVRVVSAVHSGLEECISRGAFREDLFYRLQGLVLTLPPLRERTDKRELVLHVFAQEAAATPSVSLSEDAVQALCAYPWPGNIRHLRNVLRAMIALRHADRLELGDVPAACRVRAPSPDAMPLPGTVSLNALGKAERDALLQELEFEHGNISHIARKLGVSRNTLYRKMQRLHITWPLKRPPH